MTPVCFEWAIATEDSAGINLQGIEERVPEEQNKHKESRDGVFGLADAEFDVGIHLDHSGRYNRSDEPDNGWAAVAHEGFGLFAEVEIEET